MEPKVRCETNGLDASLDLTDREIAHIFADPTVAAKYPPLLTIAEAAALVRVPIGTIRDWRSRGLLNQCSRRVGREVRFLRDRLVKQLFNEGLIQ
jgi:hypothetical protein